MTEHGYRLGGDAAGEPATDPDGAEAVFADDVGSAESEGFSEAVARADLRRSRHAVLGGEVPADQALFAGRVARAVTEVLRTQSVPEPLLVTPESGIGIAAQAAAVPAATTRPERGAHALLTDDRSVGERTEPDGTPALPLLREAVFGAGRGTDLGGALPGASTAGGPEIVTLPAAPALVCDRADRIVRVNAALLRLSGRAADAAGTLAAEEGEAGEGLIGMRLPQLVVGPDADARLVRPDGGLVRVRIVRWELPGRELRAVVVVELGAVPPAPATIEQSRLDRQWVAELERLAGVGTWSFELDTATLRRSESLVELYRSAGIDPDGADGPVEGEQVELLCRGLRTGGGNRGGPADHHVELRLPGERLLSCRAEVEAAEDGKPVRLVGVVRDLTEQRRAQDRVRHSGRRFADLMELVPSGVAMIDPNGLVVDANEAMCQLLDMRLDTLRGTPAAAFTAEGPLDLMGPDHTELPGWLRPVAPGARHGYRVDAAPLLRADGTTVWCEVTASVTSADDGGWFWLVVCTDVGERRRAAELLRSAATVDELTRLPNRAASLTLVDGLLAGTGRDRVAVVCGDLDDFARVNSSLGHEAGDDLLVSLAGRLQRELPVGCTAARLSGDEFVVICADHAEVGGPDQLARMVADLLRTTITVHGQPVQMTATVGLATPVPTGEVRAADLLRFAEVAMQDAKRRQCRGGIGMATDGVVSTATGALAMEAELRAAITGTGLVLEYQPVIGPDGTVLSAEALVRWRHPERGMIPPGDFLPVAQRSGLLRDLDLWVLRTATAEAATWPSHRGRRPAVAVNLAGLLPGDADFLSVVTAIVQDSGLDWEHLVLELVETSLVALPSHALAAMAELVSRGVRFAVDDFGTGYSSLARLKDLPAQTVKVDRAFVTGVADDPAAFAVARAVVDMARAMGRTTVAEGVETAEQFHVLRGIGVDAYQGWLFARPLAAGPLRELFAGGRVATPAIAAMLAG
ncbi:GGDEF domain-containing phosphodiesterase [Pseudonocardia sp.]|uniref:putative bifunctional diguanylate cyclase/phosphodiesterase n=1 Tax=Pseudonocardia sp. TaxID=60912 RepID=UPI0026378782|nr:GGDEF domain-containing phosphodiesterase [Pseudonocardia sp.]